MNPMKALDAITVVLSRPSHPGNIGAAARAMKTMGLSRLTLVSPRTFPDAESRARASGATDVLETADCARDLDTALAGMTWSLAVSARARDLGPLPQSARAGAAALFARALRGEPVALVFGNETSGLSNSELQRCQGVATIPSNPDYGSLNLAAAVQVLAYELRMAALMVSDQPPGSKTTPFASPLATHAEQEGFYRHLETVMIASGFLDPVRPRRILPKLRRLFSRAGLEKNEVDILRGLLRAVESGRQKADS
ncbi:MAG: RNA methyltransferase [Zoogloeaceae bacterium]|jgi:tRNA/rRNA methyltransferase|nr:RNA methyltransferase [Zoogloeaceae bacterium]